jgi:hypothetical protein
MGANESRSARDQNAPFSQHEQHSNLSLQLTKHQNVGSCLIVAVMSDEF